MVRAARNGRDLSNQAHLATSAREIPPDRRAPRIRGGPRRTHLALRDPKPHQVSPILAAQVPAAHVGHAGPNQVRASGPTRHLV